MSNTEEETPETKPLKRTELGDALKAILDQTKKYLKYSRRSVTDIRDLIRHLETPGEHRVTKYNRAGQALFAIRQICYDKPNVDIELIDRAILGITRAEALPPREREVAQSPKGIVIGHKDLHKTPQQNYVEKLKHVHDEANAILGKLGDAYNDMLRNGSTNELKKAFEDMRQYKELVRISLKYNTHLEVPIREHKKAKEIITKFTQIVRQTEPPEGHRGKRKESLPRLDDMLPAIDSVIENLRQQHSKEIKSLVR